MALEQKLQLKLSQKLIMTPSLQQAIKLLQLSKLELQEVLNQELLENPLLEESAEETKAEETETAEAEAEAPEQKAEEKKPEEKEKDSFDEIDYDAYFQDYIEYGYNPRMSEEHDEFPIENTLTRPPDLADHLSWQLGMSDAAPRIKEIATFLIGNIDEDGYLRANDEEIVSAGPYEPAEVLQALHLVQSFDPIGVCARDLRECLLLQLDYLDIEEPMVEKVIRDHWDMFMNRHFVQLAKVLADRPQAARGGGGSHPPPRSEARAEIQHRTGDLRRAGRLRAEGRRRIRDHPQRGRNAQAADQRQLPADAALDGLQAGERDRQLHQGQDPLRGVADQVARPAPADDLQGRRVDREAPAGVPGEGHRLPAAAGPARRRRRHPDARVDRLPRGFEQVHAHTRGDSS
jgi:hypothetical protein